MAMMRSSGVARSNRLGFTFKSFVTCFYG